MTIFYMRKQSLKTLYDYTREFKDTGAQEFKRKVEAYFIVDDQTRKIEQFMESEYEYAPPKLKKVLIKDNKLIPKNKLKN